MTPRLFLIRRCIHSIITLLAALGLLLTLFARPACAQNPIPEVAWKTMEIAFKSHDGYAMFGKFLRPEKGAPRAVVVYVQTAEGMTVDMKRPDGRGGTFNYF